MEVKSIPFNATSTGTEAAVGEVPATTAQITEEDETKVRAVVDEPNLHLLSRGENAKLEPIKVTEVAVAARKDLGITTEISPPGGKK